MGEGKYLSVKETVEKVYSMVKENDIQAVDAYFKSLGEDKIVVNTWIQVQCDINNVKKDPEASAKVGNLGIAYCMLKNYRVPAAMMLHNVSAFFMPDWDENIDSNAIPTIVEAARKQVPLREEIGDNGPLIWAYWDLGMAELVAGNVVESSDAFEKGLVLADETNDPDSAAWCLLFLGKLKIKYLPEEKSEGQKDMLNAAKTIMDIGQEWEKESVGPILEVVGLKL